MRIARHLSRLLRDILAFAWENKAWWIVPIVIMLLLMAALIVAGKASAPFVYTLF